MLCWLPVRRLHHFCDAGPIGLAQQCEHALLLGDALDLWLVNLCFGGATRSAFDSTDRGSFLALAAVDGTLRRDDVFDLALPFLGAVLSRLRDFAMERDDMGLGSVGSRRRN